MSDSVSKNMGKVIQIDEDQIRKHLEERVGIFTTKENVFLFDTAK